MTNIEMLRRITSMTGDQIAEVTKLVLEGWGATQIVNQTTANLKQANAIFQMVYGPKNTKKTD